MPDGPETGTPPAATQGAQQPPAMPERTFTQADLDRIVGERLARERQQYADYDDLKTRAAKLDEIEQAQRSETEKLTAERDGLKSRVPELETENLRLKVAVKKGLVGDRAWIADRLRGTDETELAADADELLAKLAPEQPSAPSPQPTPDFHGGVREPATPSEATTTGWFPQLQEH